MSIAKEFQNFRGSSRGTLPGCFEPIQTSHFRKAPGAFLVFRVSFNPSLHPRYLSSPAKNLDHPKCTPIIHTLYQCYK